MAQYLTQEWLDRRQELAAGLPERAGVTATVQHVVPGAPEGEVRYVTEIEDGRIVGGSLGSADEATVTLTTKYPDAVAVATGEADLNALFMQGRMKVAGATGPTLAVIALSQDDAHRALTAELAADTAF